MTGAAQGKVALADCQGGLISKEKKEWNKKRKKEGATQLSIFGGREIREDTIRAAQGKAALADCQGGLMPEEKKE